MNERTDTEILFPDLDVTLSDGRVVRVRELSFGESLGLTHRPDAAAFFAAALGPAGSLEFDAARVLTAGVEHRAWWLAFLVSSTGMGDDELQALRRSEAQRLAITAIEVNAGFFAETAVGRAKAVEIPSPSPTPSPSSSATDTSDQPT